MKSLLDYMRPHEFRRVEGEDGRQRIEDHCTIDEIYAANTISKAEFELIQKRQKLNEAERRREQRERYARSKDAERHDRMAEEWEAMHG